MLHNRVLILLFVILSYEPVISSKEHHEHSLNGKQNTKNPSSRRKHISYKNCPPMRCNIVCPIEVALPPPACNSGYPPFPGQPVPLPGQPVPLSPGLPGVAPPEGNNPVPVSSPVAPSTEQTTTRVSSSPSPVENSTPSHDNQTTPIFSQVANGINQVLPAISNILGNNSGQSDRHNLKHRKKHFHFKKLILANRNGKKTYKFRQMSSSCYVACPGFIEQSEIHQDPGIVYSQPGPVEGADNELDEAEDDQPYVEGEDTPIEITRAPGSPSRVGESVDFVGLDDFGPDGFPAKEFAEVAEEKKAHKKQ